MLSRRVSEMARRGDDVVRTCVTQQSRDQWWKSGAINKARRRQAQWVRQAGATQSNPGSSSAAASQRNITAKQQLACAAGWGAPNETLDAVHECAVT
jgi:hypothetical protein